MLRSLQAAAGTYRIAFGPRAGQKVLTLQAAMLKDADFKQNLCADIDGFSLHAAVRCGADDRQALVQLCRYITRPALANERVQINAAGQVVLKLKTPWSDGTTQLVMSPLEFVQGLAALVPRPRLHLTRFGVRVISLREVSGPPLRDRGVLAPNAKLRSLVVSKDRAFKRPFSFPMATRTRHATPCELPTGKLYKKPLRETYRAGRGRSRLV